MLIPERTEGNDFPANQNNTVVNFGSFCNMKVLLESF